MFCFSSFRNKVKEGRFNTSKALVSKYRSKYFDSCLSEQAEMGNESSLHSRNSSKRRANTIAENPTNDRIDADTVDNVNRSRGNTYPPAGKASPGTRVRARRESFRSSSRNSSSDKSSIFHNSDKDLPGNAHEIWDNEETNYPVKPKKRLKRIRNSKREPYDMLRQYNLQLNKPVLMNLKADFEVDKAILDRTCHLLKVAITKPAKTADSPRYLAKINFSELLRCNASGQALFAHSWMGESDSIECTSQNISMTGRFHRDTGGKFDYLLFNLTLKSFSESCDESSFENSPDDASDNNNISYRHIGFADDDVLGTFEMQDNRNPNPKSLIWKIYKKRYSKI